MAQGGSRGSLGGSCGSLWGILGHRKFGEKPIVLLSFLKIEVTAAYGDRTGIVRVEYDLVNKSRLFLLFCIKKFRMKVI